MMCITGAQWGDFDSCQDQTSGFIMDNGCSELFGSGHQLFYFDQYDPRGPMRIATQAYTIGYCTYLGLNYPGMTFAYNKSNLVNHDSHSGER